MRIALASLAFLLSGCAASRSPPSPPTTPAASHDDARAAIAHALDDFHDAAAHADEARYFDWFAPNGVFLGTDATERWDVAAFRAYAHPRFATGKAWSFRAVSRHVDLSADARVAWFDEELATEKLGPARGSGVLVQSSAGWKVAQYNLSIPIPNERFGEVRKLIDQPR
jgi:hypothetical protein